MMSLSLPYVNLMFTKCKLHDTRILNAAPSALVKCVFLKEILRPTVFALCAHFPTYLLLSEIAMIFNCSLLNTLMDKFAPTQQLTGKV